MVTELKIRVQSSGFKVFASMPCEARHAHAGKLLVKTLVCRKQGVVVVGVCLCAWGLSKTRSVLIKVPCQQSDILLRVTLNRVFGSRSSSSRSLCTAKNKIHKDSGLPRISSPKTPSCRSPT